MLTEFEVRSLQWLYKVCCKSCTTQFAWIQERMILKPKLSLFGTIWIFFTYKLLLSCLMFQIKHVPAMVGKKDVIGLILNVILLMAHVAQLIFKLNTSHSKSEIPQIINQVLEVNSNWGI